MPVSSQEYLRRIRSSAVYNVADRTPLQRAPIISERLGNSVWLKREDLQPVFSFKLRGAYNFMARLDPALLEKGVIAASAGNHAQGVALAARNLGVRSVIVVPTTTPEIKQQAITRLGAELILHGDSYDQAFEHAVQLSGELGLALVHPYDDPDVIAGQGTVGLEIHEQFSGRIDAVFVAVGGGGLISGVALALKQLRPEIRIIGVEPEDADAMFQSLKLGERVKLDRVGLLADGVAVRQVGVETFRIAQEWVDEVIVVSNDAICSAVKQVFEDTRAVLEPSGALALAGLKSYVDRERVCDQNLVAIACGANLNFDRLRHIAERSAVGERSEAVLAIHIPERPGSFRKLCEAIGERSVTEFNYRMGDPDMATVFAGLKLGTEEDAAAVVAGIELAGFDCLDLTDNEIAKAHVRHMVGGRSSHVFNEHVFHFDFPERSGALLRFLTTLGSRWNISMFHYRNHGSDRGRVLVGLQTDDAQLQELRGSLESLGYPFSEETLNPAIQLFLS